MRDLAMEKETSKRENHFERKAPNGFWLKNAASTGGVYLLAGGNCPCCGGSTCPVGFSGAVAVGLFAATAQRFWNLFRKVFSKRITS
jgi:hypothetical protein